MTRPIISVIVPVYQAEQYLEDCIESILRQKLPSDIHDRQEFIEIVLVDDGCDDNSPAICDQYAAKYPEIQVIHKENEGLTATWKTGVSYARGSYIGFVDSDDYVASDMYCRLYEEIIHTGAEIACCGIRHIFQDKSHVDWDDEMQFAEETYTKQEMREKVFPEFINNGRFMGRGLQPNRVSKLLKKELVLENMELCDNRVTVGEDYQFSFAMFLEAEKIAIIKGYLPYYYRVNTASMTGNYDEHYMEKIKLMKEQLLRISREKNVYDFSNQIQNDFLCLVVLHIKGGIMAQKAFGYQLARKAIKRVCTDPEVVTALQQCDMKHLTKAEKLFLFFMKHHLYYLIYFVVTLYFKA